MQCALLSFFSTLRWIVCFYLFFICFTNLPSCSIKMIDDDDCDAKYYLKFGNQSVFLIVPWTFGNRSLQWHCHFFTYSVRFNMKSTKAIYQQMGETLSANGWKFHHKYSCWFLVHAVGLNASPSATSSNQQ